ncbi:3-phosphoshikimate 1-carboxyvinyltransferase [Nonlabens sp.]|uniref:3-phosphoshikimate 1-carboxyvinyltransferase n=1 Tax=Nonlabens sp. TaxID=1888209 RepID=UPI003F696705
MDVLLQAHHNSINKSPLFTITGSKSESNRLLILQALFPELEISNLSNSDDTVHMQQALASLETTINIGHAGTAMRFLTAYVARKDHGEVILTGSERMQERPIGILVDALRSIGAQINYVDKEGYPPLYIKGGHINGSSLKIDATVSSQYITALMLIAPSLKNGLEIELLGKLTSRPYLEMTAKQLESIGVDVLWNSKTLETADSKSQFIKIKPLKSAITKALVVESDWSSAGYWYSWVALQQVGYELTLQHYFLKTLQGDHKLKDYYEAFGVQTKFEKGKLILKKISDKLAQRVVMNLVNEPDQAQTIFATCLALGVNAYLTGLHTLRIKETDRLEAMKEVGLRFRESEITTTHDSITLSCEPLKTHDHAVVIDTYNDHRMAMAFAPLSCKTPLIIKDALVVSKSYPTFWEDLKRLNINITEI